MAATVNNQANASNPRLPIARTTWWAKSLKQYWASKPLSTNAYWARLHGNGSKGPKLSTLRQY